MQEEVASPPTRDGDGGGKDGDPYVRWTVDTGGRLAMVREQGSRRRFGADECGECGRRLMRWTLDGAPTSAAVARDLVRAELPSLDAQLESTVVLLTDELVANAVRHGEGPVQLALCVAEDHVRVTVSDEAIEAPTGVGEPDVTRPSGRGLFLVDALSTRWGVDPQRVGKSVWFELDRS